MFLTVDCSVESVKVLVDTVFIFLLLDFLKTSTSSLSKPPPATPESLSPLATNSFSQSVDSVYSLNEPESPIPAPVVEAPKEKSEDKSSGRLTVKLKVLRPLIALLKDAEVKNSQALVLGVSLYVLQVRGA